jgi:BlaI family penicillinase repressor
MSETESLPPLTEAQMEIMNVVWDKGEATVAEVRAKLPGRRELARNTILTVMDRLVEKGWLLRDTAGHAHRYRAAVTREATLNALVGRLVATTFGGSAEGLVMALLHGRGVSKQEAERIRAMIDKTEGQNP